MSKRTRPLDESEAVYISDSTSEMRRDAYLG